MNLFSSFFMMVTIRRLHFSGRRNLFRLVLLAAVLGTGASLRALVPEPYTLGISYYIRLHTTNGVSGASLVPQLESAQTASVFPVSAGYWDSDVKLGWMKPGKQYTIFVYGTGADYELNFIPPDGYDLYVDGSRTDLIFERSGGLITDSYTVELRPVARGGSDEAATFSGIGVGQAFDWNIGLGYLPSGRSAGRIRFREMDLSNDPADRARLYYDEPESVYGMTQNDMGVVRDGGSGQVLKQIMMPQTFVEIVDLSGTPADGYTINFYKHADANWNSGMAKYDLVSSPTPWKTIRVEQPSGSSFKVTETEGSATRISLLTLTSGSIPSGAYVWTLQEGDGTTWSRTTTHTSTVPTSGVREDVAEVRDAGNTPSAKTKYHYEDQGWGEEVTTVTTNPDGGGNALTRTFVYHTDDTKPGNYRRVKSITEANGQWVGYEYYDDHDRLGQLKYEFHPWGNSPSDASSLSTTTGRVVTRDYDYDWTGRKKLEISAEEKVNNTQRGLTATDPDDNLYVHGFLLVERVADSSASSSSGDTLRTITREAKDGEKPDYVGKPFLIKRPDGSQDSFMYYYGSYNYSTKAFTAGSGVSHWREVTWHGSSSSSGADSFSSYDGNTIEQIYLVPNKSTRDEVIRNSAGRVVRTATYVYTGSGSFSTDPIASEDLTYDDQGRLTQRVSNNGATVTYSYSNGQLVSTTDAAGTETTFTCDELWRVLSSTKKAASGGTDLVTRYTYDGSDRVLSETVGYGLGENLYTSRQYDLSGRPTVITPPGLGNTTFAYDNTYRTRTTTAPDGGTTIETWQLDGRLASITGTAVVSQTYSYSYDGDRLLTELQNGSSSRWQKTWQDWLGRTVKTERPGWPGQYNYVETMTYDGTTGLLTKLERRDSNGSRLYDDTLYEYDSLGRLTRSGLDVSNGGSLVLASSDRITDINRSFENYSSAWWLHEEVISYPTTSSATTHIDSLVRTRLTGFSGILSETQTTTTNGAVITQTTSVNTGTKTLTRTTSQAGIDNSTETVVNGLLATQTGSDGLTTTYHYDGLDRLHEITDARSNTTSFGYVWGSSLRSTVTDPASKVIATQTYDGNGRLASSKDANNQYTYYSYNTRSQLHRQWGGGASPVEYGYDSTYGDRTTQKTYRAGTGWDGGSWPGSPGAADTVTWAYDAATGLLNSKTDALSHAESFSYNARGQTYQRVADRGPSATVTTTYTYSGSTGELTGLGYSDGTTSVTYDYDRLGHVYQVGDATGTRTFDLCACGRVNYETLPSSFYGTRVLTYLYETSGGVVGRYKGFQLGSSSGSNADLEQVYTFTSGGLFDTLATKRASNSVTRTFDYGYLTNSALVNALAITGGHAFSVAYAYDGRNLLTSIDAKWSSTSQTKFEYTYTDAWQRQTAKQSGAAYADYWSGLGYSSVYNLYTYNGRGEVQTAAMYRGDTASSSPALGEELPGRRFEYRYDPIGNRTTSGTTGSAAAGDDEYTANAANQYTVKENNTVSFSGTAAANAGVAVAGAKAVSKQDRAWGGNMIPANASSAVKGSTNVYAAIPGGGTAGADLIKTESKAFFVPKRNQTFSYDYAGNLTQDSVWDYTYDAENRLVSMQTRSEVIGTGMLANSDARRLEFTYDYLGRRVQKIVRGGFNGSSYTTVVSNRKYLYDDWNVIAEFDAVSTLTLVRSYTWGLDLTGSLTATGGVGALLQIRDHAKSRTWLPTYDGNGNVVALLDAEAGSVVIAAVYEHGPFGEPLRAEVKDADAEGQAFRFSTKFTDTETGLVYYGKRYYSPTLGRFINRDPIEEQGGLNLYGFASNNGVSHWDVLGAEEGVLKLPPFVVPGHRPPELPPPEFPPSVPVVIRSSDNRPLVDEDTPDPREPISPPPSKPQDSRCKDLIAQAGKITGQMNSTLSDMNEIESNIRLGEAVSTAHMVLSEGLSVGMVAAESFGVLKSVATLGGYLVRGSGTLGVGGRVVSGVPGTAAGNIINASIRNQQARALLSAIVQEGRSAVYESAIVRTASALSGEFRDAFGSSGQGALGATYRAAASLERSYFQDAGRLKAIMEEFKRLGCKSRSE